MQLNILNMPIDRFQPRDFVNKFVDRAGRKQSGYVCVPNVHQCMLAYDDPEFRQVITGATYVISDSVVLNKFINKKYKLPAIDVLRGDQLTLEICREAAERQLPIALIGGKDDVVLSLMVDALLGKVPGLQIVYSWSPPFRDLTSEEEECLISDLQRCGAAILFVGLGCPKQERWMARYTNQLPQMMIGVGAAFDFISGEVNTSAGWVHRAGFEWLHRLISEPRRLWKRYLLTSPRFIWLFFIKRT